ncbi:NAD-dependent epimerase/dehydratase family protein [Peribacillus sp. NPDC097295]|uniref:NAD-dependent epimerase/dehydratase family protein n=1 Tax=Peribacillus sp. NPDC097295 TaxID=3364402 RepID=UPI0038223AF2
MTKKTALILGATGVVGTQLINVLSTNKNYEVIHLLSRREVEYQNPRCRLQIVDFDNLDKYRELFHVNDVFICLGTTIKKAKTKEAFRKVDYEYVVEAGKLANAAKVENVLVISARGADSKSKFFYSRVKGEMEETLIQLELNSLHIFRPSLLLGERNELRIGEKVAGKLSSIFKFLLIGPLRPYRAIHAKKVATAMSVAAQSRSTGTHVYHSNEIEKLANGR